MDVSDGLRSFWQTESEERRDWEAGCGDDVTRFSCYSAGGLFSTKHATLTRPAKPFLVYSWRDPIKEMSKVIYGTALDH